MKTAEPGALGRRTELRILPAICDVSVTNVCNARCSFCSYAYDKHIVTDKRRIDSAEFARALPILYRRGIRYVNFQGGEPLMHPEIVRLVADSRTVNMCPGLITNGWLLPQKIESLANAGLGNLLVSIDSHSLEDHEHNRGLSGVCERIHQGLDVARRHGVPTVASVTVSRLVNYQALPNLLRELGFDAVTFSYPRRKPLGSSSLVFSEKSPLIDFETDELIRALEAIESLKKQFRVLNPSVSLQDIQHHVRGEKERFACVGGHKYFYLDWNLNIWRCENWAKPLGSVFELDSIPDCRDHCTACMMSCYRDTSVLMHAGVALEDAIHAIITGQANVAARLLFRRTVAQSLGSVVKQAQTIFKLAKYRKRRGQPLGAPCESARGLVTESNQPPGQPDQLPGSNVQTLSGVTH